MAEHVQASLGAESVLLVDARAPERFEGRIEPIDRTPGHIPGARNHFYKRNVDDRGRFLPPAALREQITGFEVVRTGKGVEHALEVPSTVGALAFLPKGFRLAIAHYGGATLWFPSAQAEPAAVETVIARPKQSRIFLGRGEKGLDCFVPSLRSGSSQ